MATKRGMMTAALSLAGPVFAEESYSLLLSAVIVAIVGNLGPHDLAAFSLAFLLQGSVVSIVGVIGIGAAILTAREVGAGNWGLLRQIAGQTLALGVAGGVVLGCAGHEALPHLHSFVDTDEKIALLTEMLLQPLCLFVPFSLVTWLGKSILRGMGETRLAFVIIAVNNTTVLIATCLLIYACHPGLGVLGAVWGAGAGSVASAITTLILLFSHRQLALKIKNLCQLKVAVVSQILRISLPVAWEQLALQFGFTLYNLELINVGAKAFAGNQIAQQLEGIPQMIGVGFSAAVLTVVGQSLGKNRPQVARQFARFSGAITIVAMPVLCALIALVASPLTRLFTADPEVASWSVACILLAILEQPTMAATMILGHALRGSGDTFWPACSSVIGMWLIRIPLTYFLITAQDYGITTAWLITATDYFVRSVILSLRFFQTDWEKRRLFFR
ncbi:MAG: MATE family efflux transporter [Negativicutes bacterium]|nr:MATE family efflux transporter [Negativicutes bacterium]